MSYTATIQRQLRQVRDQENNIAHFRQAITNKPSWEITNVQKHRAEQFGDGYAYPFTFSFAKTKGQMDEKIVANEWKYIVSQLRRLCNSTKWQGNPWELIKTDPEVGNEPMDVEMPEGEENNDVQSAIVSSVDLQTVKDQVGEKIDQMLVDDDFLRREFSGIYDRGPQIRTLLSAVKSFLISNGARRSHCAFFGRPSCAKTQILLRLKEILPEGSVLRLDATSTTSAGIYKTFFNDYRDQPVPPFVFIEEIEKTSEEALRVWLGALDDRGELRKMNYRENNVRHINILCLATANDKQIFDKLMGGSENKPGALSSRFVNQIYCPRPTRHVMGMILKRNIKASGGNLEWVEPALKLAEDVGTDDPRKVLSFLDGADRLLTGEYQKDILKIHELHMSNS